MGMRATEIRLWTQDEEKYLKKNYSNKSNLVLAIELDRSEQCVKKKASRMGLSKSVKYRRKKLGHKIP